ncbi:MAG TPA: class I SAM-dependent methyltransferase [Solirubrobacterales bacterium]
MGRIYDATWGRGFAAIYDRAFEATEEAGLREIRRAALAEASGRTIDIGSGTGANLSLYPEGVTELVLAEPDPHMLKKLQAKVGETGIATEVVQAPAESLPFEESSFDTAVFTLVLCTVPNPKVALAEVARILRPGGRLLFVEHVRSKDAGLARWQDRLEKPWRFLGDGCHCNRDTVATIEASRLTLDDLVQSELPKTPPIVRPLVRGSASLSA